VVRSRGGLAVAAGPPGDPLRGATIAPGGPTRGIGRSAQPDPPAALPDLELTETGRAELGDQGRQELAGESIDRRVIRGTVGIRATGPAVGR